MAPHPANAAHEKALTDVAAASPSAVDEAADVHGPAPAVGNGFEATRIERVQQALAAGHATAPAPAAPAPAATAGAGVPAVATVSPSAGPAATLGGGSPESVGNMHEARARAAALAPALEQEAAAAGAKIQALIVEQQEIERTRKAKEAELAALRPGLASRIWASISSSGQASNAATSVAATQVADLKAREKKIEAEQAGLAALRAKAMGDLRVINEPGAGPAAVYDVVRRRAAPAGLGQTTDEASHGFRINEKGFVAGASRESSRLDAAGVQRTDKGSGTLTIDPTTGVERVVTASHAASDGDKSTTATTVETKGVKWGGPGAPSYTEGTTNTRVVVDPAAGPTRTEVNASSITAGLAGVSESVTQSAQVGSNLSSQTDTRSVNRGGGAIGVGGERKTIVGTVDPTTQRLVDGATTGTKGNADVLLGPSAVGAQGAISRDKVVQHSKGVSTSRSIGADCKFFVNVAELPGARYQLELTIKLGAKVGVGETIQHESGGDVRSTPGSSVSGTVSGGVSGSVTVKFIHTMSEEEKTEYLASIGAAAGGQSKGKNREAGILYAVAHEGLQPAIDAARAVGALFDSAESAKNLSEGAGVELTTEVKGELGGSLTGKSSSPFSAGVTAGVSKTDTTTRGIARKGGKIVVTLSVSDEEAPKLGGSLSYLMATGSHLRERKVTRAHSVTFTLTPGTVAPDGTISPEEALYRQQYDEIHSARGVDEIVAVVQRWPVIVTSYAEAEGSADTATTSAALSAASFEQADSAERGLTRSLDERGSLTTTYTGANQGATTARGPQVDVATKTREALGLSVDSAGAATGDLTRTTTDTSFAETIAQLPSKLENQIVGLYTGATKIVESTIDVAGMRLSNADLDNVVERARIPYQWELIPQTPQLVADWRETGRMIRAANGDRLVIAKALTDFIGTRGGGRAGLVEEAVRRKFTGRGGKRYEWPHALAEQKRDFDSLVLGDPLAGATVLEKEGKTKEALDAVNGAGAKLLELAAVLKTRASQFGDQTAYAEMLALLEDKRALVHAERAILALRLSRPAVASAATTADAAAAAAADEDAQVRQRVTAESQYRMASSTLAGYKATELRLFGQIDAEYTKTVMFGLISLKPDATVEATVINKLRELHVLWNLEIERYKQVSQQLGREPLLDSDRVPDAARLVRAYVRFERLRSSGG